MVQVYTANYTKRNNKVLNIWFKVLKSKFFGLSNKRYGDDKWSNLKV